MENVGYVKKITAPVVNSFSKQNDVVAMLCFGSYALNTFDQYSDIDLFVVCDLAIMPESTRRDIFRVIPTASDIQLNCTTPGWDDQWSPEADKLKLGQSWLDVSYNTRDWLATVVHKVTTEGAVSIPECTFRPYTILGLLSNAITLYDPQGFIRELRSRLDPYPARLKERLIADNLSILTDRLNELQDCVARDLGNSTFLFHLWHACDAFVSILFALDERYDPATKRPEREFKKLRIAPPDLEARYERLLEGPFDAPGKWQTVEKFRELAEETMRLIEAN